MRRACIQDISVSLPENRVSNTQIDREHPEWRIDSVLKRTGVKNRHIAADDETALDLGYRASLQLFEKNPTLRDQIDTVIFCTQSPDHIIPPNSCLLHNKLQLPEHVAVFDISHACSGFVYTLGIAHALVQSQAAKNVLLVTADTYSKYINVNDRSTRVLFGDGGAACWVSGNENGQGVLGLSYGTSGVNYDKFIVPAGACRIPKSASTREAVADQNGNLRSQEDIHMSGNDILVFVNDKIPDHVREFLKSFNFTISDIDLFVFHQASLIVLETLARSLDIDMEIVFQNLGSVGNTVSASIPIAMNDALKQGKIQPGHKVLICGFGAGLSWGSALLQF